MKSLLPVLTICLLFSNCESVFDNTDRLDLDDLNGNTYIYTIDRVSDAEDVQFPSDELYEDDYEDTDVGTQHEITFSEDGQAISISHDSISGVLYTESRKELNFNLNEGLFAGGRFLVWIEDDHFEAEMVIYGSGVPIVGGSRGVLELRNK